MQYKSYLLIEKNQNIQLLSCYCKKAADIDYTLLGSVNTAYISLIVPGDTKDRTDITLTNGKCFTVAVPIRQVVSLLTMSNLLPDPQFMEHSYND